MIVHSPHYLLPILHMTRRSETVRSIRVSAARRSGSCVPLVEALEDRLLMSKSLHAKVFGRIEAGAVPWQNVLVLPSPIPT